MPCLGFRKCDYAIHVDITVSKAKPLYPGHRPRTGVRHFTVEYDADGNVQRIKENEKSYWVATSHALGTSGNTIPKRIIAAARVVKAREWIAAHATP